MNSEPNEITNHPVSPEAKKKEIRQKCTPPEYRQEIVLRDGGKVLVRPITCNDRGELLAFYSRLSEETRFLRYHYSKGALTEDDLRDFCELDYYDDLALVVEMAQNQNKIIIGVGRYYRLADKVTAEVAFVVQDSEQGKGVGTQLLKHLAILAWQRDVIYFTGEVLRTNARMLNIFLKCDPKMVQVPDTTTCDIKLSVQEAIRRSPRDST
jgi:GNAT superfamily N-acetyltransferase